MWFPKPVPDSGARLAALSAVLKTAAIGAALAGLILGVESCGVDHSGDPGLITVTVDSSATRFGRFTVVMRDSAGGKADTLFDDSLKDPSQLRRIVTADYRGGKTEIVLTGYKNELKVYEETRTFNGADPASTKKDTALDLNAALKGLAWTTKELVLPLGDTTRTLAYVVEPKKADVRVEASLSDSSVLEIRAEAGKTAFRLLPKKVGSTGIAIRSLADPDLNASATLLVTAPPQPVPKPVNTGSEWSTDSRPAWKWKSGGGKGIGYYRVRVDNDSMSGAKNVNDTIYVSPEPLGQGPHTLYVQERDSAGNWSQASDLRIKVDLIPPQSPTVKNDGYNPTNDTTPSWSWTPGGGGNGTFRYRIDGEDLDAGGTVTTLKSLTAPARLDSGEHVLRVQERDSAGNWSVPGLIGVFVLVDTIPPNAPVFKPIAPNGVLRDSMPWGGGGGGSGHYRYLVDRNDFVRYTPILTDDSCYTPDLNMDTNLVRHALYVEERDSVGNWSQPTRIDFNTVRLSFLQSQVGDSNYVLTTVPDSGIVRLTRMVTAPKNDAERALRHRQLWATQESFNGPSRGFAILNPFIFRYLKAGPYGGRLTLGVDETTKGDIFYFIRPLLLPPPKETVFLQLLSMLNNDWHLNVRGDAPWDEQDDIILWEQGHGDPNEMWRFTKYTGAWFVD
jgi:hypothetical protein